MEKEKRAPEGTLFPNVISVSEYKKILLNSNSADGIIYRLLLNSKPLSTVEIVNLTGFADPNATIRNLRKCGIKVGDYWEDQGARRYKKFFIRKENHNSTLFQEYPIKSLSLKAEYTRRGLAYPPKMSYFKNEGGTQE